MRRAARERPALQQGRCTFARTLQRGRGGRVAWPASSVRALRSHGGTWRGRLQPCYGRMMIAALQHVAAEYLWE